MQREPQQTQLWGLLLLLALLGGALWWTHVPGVFIIDENHHIAAIRSFGQPGMKLTVPKGIEPSLEMATFDATLAEPVKHRKRYHRSPLTPTIPPAYPLLAKPFAVFGFSGLVFLNILAFLGCALLVFVLARVYSNDDHIPWLATLFFLVGSCCIEYAQGLWPHMLSAFLCFAGLVAAVRAQQRDHMTWAACAGLLLGLAIGVRYPNVIWGVMLGVSLWFWAPRRRIAWTYGLTLLLPIAYNSLYNFIRLGSWNPISKGGGYFVSYAGKASGSKLLEPLLVLWTRIFDFSHTPLYGQGGLRRALKQSLAQGAPVLDNAIKKSWLQSSPWLIIALCALIAIWWTKRASGGSNDNEQSTPDTAFLFRSVALITGMWLAAFAYAGIARHDGWCYNQRYLLDLYAPMAVVLALSLRRVSWRWLTFFVGTGLGLVIVKVVLAYPPMHKLRILFVTKLPLALAALLCVAWLLALRQKSALLLQLCLGLSLSWSLGIHLGEDVMASHSRRRFHHGYAKAVQRVLQQNPKQPSVLFAYAGVKDPFGPLTLRYPLTLLDPWLDQARDANRLAKEFLKRGHSVYVVEPKFFHRFAKRLLLKNMQARWLSRKPEILELRMMQ